MINDIFNVHYIIFPILKMMHHVLHGHMLSIVSRSLKTHLKVSWNFEYVHQMFFFIEYIGSLTFIEADILIGTSSPSPIMAHPPHKTSDLTFSEFLKALKSTSKGLKLDFKDINALQPCLNELEAQKDNVSLPKSSLIL